MSPDFSIRPATPSDVPAIAAIYGDAVRTGTATFELEPPTPDEMAARMTSLLSAGYPYLVATSDRVLGYAYAGAYRPRPGYRHTCEDSIYIAPEAHRRGIGRALLATLIAECEARDFRQMIAVIGDSGLQASIGLHRAAGFTVAGTFPAIGHKFGRWLDSVLMQRTLGAGGSAPPTR